MKRKRNYSHSPQVPDRWIPCPRHSNNLIADLFVASKTFLDDKFDSQLTVDSFFKPEAVKDIEALFNVNIGIVIDLNNSQRYYNPELLTSVGVTHVKIACTGRDGTPNEEQTTEFISFVENIVKFHPQKKILVHCTHGFNRTGFMIISYLVRTEGMDVTDALEFFAKFRPPGIYKQDYIETLLKMYAKDGKTFSCPPLPDWCSFEGHVNDDKKDVSKIPKIEQPEKKEGHSQMLSIKRFPLKDEKIISVDEETVEELKKEIMELFDFKTCIFPACQPVSLSHENISLLETNPYMVSWKADGTRYLIYIKDRGKVYMIGRDFNIFQVPHLTFPSGDDLTEHVKNTIMDGEFVFEKDGEILRPRFLLFDLMYLNRLKIDADFSQRLHLINKEIIRPRDEAFKTGLVDRSLEAFSVRCKVFADKSKVKKLFEVFMKDITHETDGLVFQPEDKPFLTGTSELVLKWKPEELNTVDFYLTITSTVRPGCLKEYEGELYVMGSETCFAKIEVNKELMKHNKKIIECRFDRKVNRWRFLRVREDRVLPNSITTAISVCKTIGNPVNIQDIYKVIYKEQPTKAPVTTNGSNQTKI